MNNKRPAEGFAPRSLTRVNSSMVYGERTAITQGQSLEDQADAANEKKLTKSREADVTSSKSNEKPAEKPAEKNDEDFLKRLTAMESKFNQEIDELKAGSQEKDERIDILAAENRQLRQVNELQAVSNFVDGLVANQQCKPCDRQSKIQGILSMPNNVTVEYGEEGSTRSMTPRAWYMEDLTNGPKLWGTAKLPGAEDTPDEVEANASVFGSSVDLDSIKLDRKIRAYAKENGIDANKNYVEAVELYSRDHKGVTV
ncbi:MAG: hypothetical protein ACRCZS_07425 [Chroococcidiopsis sp.]